MTMTSWPFDAADVSETQFSLWSNSANGSGVLGVPDGTELRVTGDSSGLQVKMAPGFARVRGHAFLSDAVVTIAIAAGDAQPRIDAVVLELDPAADTILPKVVKGTPAASPVAPALTITDGAVFHLLLALVNVPPSAATITAGNVTDRREFAGMTLQPWTTANRPLNPSLRSVGINLSTGIVERWSGSAWVPVLNTVTADQVSDSTAIGRAVLRAASRQAVREAAGIFVRSTPLDGSNAVGDLRFWG